VGEEKLHFYLINLVLISALFTFVSLFITTAPYGKFARKGWGPSLPARWAWIIYETPSVVLFAWVFFNGERWMNPVPLMLFFIWQFHYFYRTYIYPWRLKNSNKKTPLLVILIAFVFTSVNSYINAKWIGDLGYYETSWFFDFRFIIGSLIFVFGWLLNISSDNILLGLRKDGETGYKIPYGWPFKYVTCPNYLGEILIWTGWFFLTWSPAGFAFMVFTFANLFPRAISGHRWYKKKFPEYPVKRKAIIPGII
jgi:protein-S-isoprenylcysteine O-methyltransferase Ste14